MLDLHHLLEHLDSLRYGNFTVACTTRPGTPLDQRKYVVKDLAGNVWDANEQDFVYDPFPSNRTEDHMRRTRFNLQHATQIAHRLHQQDPGGV